MNVCIVQNPRRNQIISTTHFFHNELDLRYFEETHFFKIKKCLFFFNAVLKVFREKNV